MTTTITQALAMIEEAQLVLEATADTLGDMLQGMKESEPEPEYDGPTDEEISMNLSGTPDLHRRAPSQFAAMRHLYDPAKEPFTANQFHLYGRFGTDARRYKPVEVDGYMARQTTPQHGAANWYWISRGYLRIGEDVWYKRITTEDGITSAEAEQYFRDYPDRDIDLGRGCPERYRSAFDSAW